MTTIYDKLFYIFSNRKFKKVNLNFNENIIIDIEYSFDGIFNVCSRKLDYDEFIKEKGDYLFRKWSSLSARRYKYHCIKTLLKVKLFCLEKELAGAVHQPLFPQTSKIFYIKPRYVNIPVQLVKE